MIKKWIKLLVTVSLIATIFAAWSSSREAALDGTGETQPAGTVTITVNYKETLWEYVEAMKDEDSTVIGLLYLPDPCVIQIAKAGSQEAEDTYSLQIKNCETEKIMLNVDVTKESIDKVLNAVVKTAESFAQHTGENASRTLLDSIKGAAEDAGN